MKQQPLGAHNIPVIVIVGQPNVGKSTLFNALTRTRSALVADLAGVTRDPLVGEMGIDSRTYILIDTGGFQQTKSNVQQRQHAQSVAIDEIDKLINQRIHAMIDEADLVLVMVEKATLPSNDITKLIKYVRRSKAHMQVVLNKSDKASTVDASAWYKIDPKAIEISAAHRRGLGQLQQAIAYYFDTSSQHTLSAQSAVAFCSGSDTLVSDHHTPRIAIAGRPNSGKSTLVNYLLGSNTVITSDMPGATRDVLAFDCQHGEHHFTLLDTPGVRRWAKLDTTLEKFSVLKSREALAMCDVAIVLIDGEQGLVEHDLRLLSQFSRIAPSLVVGVNKMDALDVQQKQQLVRELDWRAPALAYTPIRHISARKGKGITSLTNIALHLATKHKQHIATSRLNSVLQNLLSVQQPPVKGRFRPKLKFIHQISNRRRCTLRITGNQLDSLSQNYRTYIRNGLVTKLKLHGICVEIEYSANLNPYTEKRA